MICHLLDAVPMLTKILCTSVIPLNTSSREKVAIIMQEDHKYFFRVFPVLQPVIANLFCKL